MTEENTAARLAKTVASRESAKNKLVRNRLVEVEAQQQAVADKATYDRKVADAEVADAEACLAEARRTANELEAAAAAAERAAASALAAAEMAHAAPALVAEQAQQTSAGGKRAPAAADALSPRSVPGGLEEEEATSGLPRRSPPQRELFNAARKKGDFYSSHVSRTERERTRKLYLAMSVPALNGGSADPAAAGHRNTTQGLDGRLLAPTESRKQKLLASSPGETEASVLASPPKKGKGRTPKSKKKKRRKKGRGVTPARARV